ncbi:hypothetical protein [Salinisphaera sp. Q1T1-3]|uniref:hypothetical protein n=1 Tax=Salinisphaera sp. Q1T1-3 TaxID=2321229 RepID=UPI0011C3A983|nr:hypothetical protein [Salinisphaera sp. Q1T1-3]
MSFARSLTAGLLLATMLVLAGCAGTPKTPTPKPTTPSGPPPAATVIVPSDDSVLAQAAMQALRQRGFHLTRYSAAMTRGSDDYRLMARKARYRLTLRSESIGRCRNGQTSLRYRLALIENANGNVPVSLSGADCLDAIRQALTTELDRDRIRAGRATAGPR